MIQFRIIKDTTSVILPISIFDSSSTVGGKLTGLTDASAGLTAYYNRSGAAGAAVPITLVSATKGTWTSGGFVAIDGTNMPGDYELHIPDAAIFTGASSVAVQLKGATNMVPVNIMIELVEADVTGVSGSSSINTRATGFVPDTGTFTGTYTDTRLVDGVVHQWDDNVPANQFDGYYTFNIGNTGVPVGVTAIANLQSANDTVTVWGYNWVSPGFEEIGTLPGTGSISLAEYSWPLFTSMVGTGANSGEVRVRFSILSGGSNPSLQIDAIYVSYAVIPSEVLFEGIATGGGPSTITFPATASTEVDFYKPGLIVLTGGTGVGQARRITDYSAGRVATIATPWVIEPTSGTRFEVKPWASVRVSEYDPDVIDAQALNVDAIAKILTTQMTEGYAADGVAPTMSQALFQILGREYEFAIAGDTLTVKKLDGTTTAMTFTLAPPGGPYTSITRAS